MGLTKNEEAFREWYKHEFANKRPTQRERDAAWKKVERLEKELRIAKSEARAMEELDNLWWAGLSAWEDSRRVMLENPPKGWVRKPTQKLKK